MDHCQWMLHLRPLPDPTVLFHLLPLPLKGGGGKEHAGRFKGRGRGKTGNKRKGDKKEPASSSNLQDRFPPGF